MKIWFGGKILQKNYKLLPDVFHNIHDYAKFWVNPQNWSIKITKINFKKLLSFKILRKFVKFGELEQKIAEMSFPKLFSFMILLNFTK